MARTLTVLLASVTGLAFPNPDGTIGFGLTVVTVPGGAPVHVDADITLASLSGAWRDSTGATGSFAFAPGGASGGSPRPPVSATLPSSVLLLATGNAPGTSGPRMLWHEARKALRAGEAEFGAWSDANIGIASAAFGHGTFASGQYSTAFGDSTAATGYSRRARAPSARRTPPFARRWKNSGESCRPRFRRFASLLHANRNAAALRCVRARGGS